MRQRREIFASTRLAGRQGVYWQARMTAPQRDTPAGLPPTIEALRARLGKGELTVAEALTAQHEALRRDGWECVTHLQDLPVVCPHVSLPLAGVGLAHKDIFVLPHRLPGCGVGHPPLGWHPTGRATVVQRLVSAGAPPLALLGMAPFAGGATAENDTSPRMLNPIDPDAAVGGSSSGSGVAVAAGLSYASLGTDTAGSVRMPAATCGIVGLKTTYGLLPNQGVAPLASSLDTVGILARRSADLMTTFTSALTAPQARQLRAIHEAAQREAPRIRVSWTHANPGIELSPAVAQALDALACTLKAHAERPLDHLRELQRLAEITLYAEAADVHARALREQAPLPHLVRNLALAGSAIPVAWYQAARREQPARLREFMRTAFEDADILLTPALPQGVPDARVVTTSSPDFQPRALVALFSWMSFVNYLGLPAIVLPIGRDARARPISVQAIARPGREGQLIAWAQHIEQRCPTHFPLRDSL